MKKNLLAVLIASSIGLYGCGDEKGLSGNPTIDPVIDQSLKAETKIKFDIISDPANPVVVTPTFLAMDSMDGTLSVDGSNGSDGYSTDLTNPQVAMGKTDGWSTSQPFVIEFTGHDLDPATAEKGFRLLESNNPTLAKKAIKPKLLAADEYYQAIASGKKLTVILKQPLKPGTDYMFAITDELKDVKGNSVGMTGSYAVLKATAKPPSEKLAPAQDIVHASEQELASVGIDADSIIFSSWFTTASVGNVLSTTKGVIAKTIEAVKNGKAPETIWKGDANPNNADLSSLYQMDITEVTDISTFFNNNPILKQLVSNDQDTIDTLVAAYSSAKIYTGTINLPYFLSDSTENKAWKTTPWESAVPSLAKIKYILTDGSDADKAAVMASLDGIDITKLLTGDSDEFTKLIGLKVTLADGSQLDKERLITQYSPLPKVKSVAKVPVLLILPPNANPGAVIYQHGITSVKETAYLFGAQHLGMAGVGGTGATPKAIIAIDHPLHGQRALKDKTVTTPDTADVYMNLNYLNVARDNIRQSVIDSLGVRTSLAVMSQLQHPVLKEINVGDVSFFGHSMGAITGIGTYNLGNQSLGLENDEQEAAAGALFNFTSGAFANPGGGIPSLLLESKTFGPTIKHSLLLGAKNDAYTAECGDASKGGECFTTFYNSLDETTQGSINATFSLFAYAAQTVLDTVDPYNLASGVTGPVYVMQADNDSVVPNQTTNFSTFGGTEPLAAQLGLTELKDSTNGAIKHIARFDADSMAQHSTVIGPQYLDSNGDPINEGTAKTATFEAQLQVATFTANAGKAVIVSNPGLIDPEK